MPKIEKSGCFGCKHSEWDADGATCAMTGLLVGDYGRDCKKRAAEKQTDSTELHKVSSRPKSEQYVCISCGKFCYYPHCKSGIPYKFCPNCGRAVRGYA